MYQELTFKIRGVVPLLLHNGRLADPLDTFSRRLKAVTSKRNKTEDDYRLMAEIEWYGGLYTKDDKVVIPGHVVEAMLIDAAKKTRQGRDAKAGLMCVDDFPLRYDGPQDIDELWAGGRHSLTCGVRVRGSRVMRTRPQFDDWELYFTVLYEPSVLDENDVLRFVKTAGEIVGLCDWRPRFGRFVVTEGLGPAEHGSAR
jgi:hypothetical protein